MEVELRWASNRPSSGVKQNHEVITSDMEEPFVRCLTACEHKYLADYSAKWPGMACQLNQNPEEHGMHSTSLFMHTLIKNLELIVCDSIPTVPGRPKPAVRWFFGTEALATQGFPVHPCFPARDSMMTSFNVHRASRKPRVVCGQGGNSMAKSCAAVSQLFGYSELRPQVIAPVFKMLVALKRRASDEAREQQQASNPKKPRV